MTLVDEIIEHRPNDARYYIGNVQWKAGELRGELRRRVWNVLNADPSVRRPTSRTACGKDSLAWLARR